MALKSITLASIVLLTSVSAEAALIEIDFEDFESPAAMSNTPNVTVPFSARISDQYLVSNGVLFSSETNTYIAAVNLGMGHATSGSTGVGGSTADDKLTYSGEFFRANFFNPSNASLFAVTNYVSIRGDNITDGTGGVFSAFDVNGALLGSDSQTNVQGNTFILEYEGIHSVTFTGSGTIALDDFVFNEVTAVPVPAAVWLFGSGLLGLVGIARRKKV